MGDLFRFYAPRSPAAAAGERIRIAIVGLIPNLGDNVLVFPLVDAIRAKNPTAEISCFTYGAGRILALHPEVDHHYSLSRAGDWRARYGMAADVHDIWRCWRREFRHLRFDVCVVPRCGSDPYHSAHLAWLLGGRERVGFSSGVEPERRSTDLWPDVLLSIRVEEITRIHEAERGSQLLELARLIKTPIDINRPVGSIVSLAQTSAAQRFKESFAPLRGAYGIVAPGSSHGPRRWPSERFAALARTAIAARGWTPVFVGGPDEAAMCEQMAEEVGGPSLNLAGKTDFEQLAAVCAGARCFIGNDSGTGHVAGACGVPTLVVAAYASSGPATHHSCPQRSRPVGPLVMVVQPKELLAPCVGECTQPEAHCIAQVSVAEMQEAFEDLMGTPEPIAASADRRSQRG